MSQLEPIRKIAVIGNACGGKTRLSLQLAHIYGLPVTHVDRIQFQEHLIIRPYQESIQVLNAIQSTDCWIIDGYGPFEASAEKFMAKAKARASPQLQ